MQFKKSETVYNRCQDDFFDNDEFENALVDDVVYEELLM